MGSFLAQGVVRASLGDILAEEGRAVLFVKTELAPHFLSQIDKIGRVGVQITKGFTDPLPQAHSFQPMGGVVASERLDCLLGLWRHRVGKSRADGARGFGFRQP